MDDRDSDSVIWQDDHGAGRRADVQCRGQNRRLADRLAEKSVESPCEVVSLVCAADRLCRAARWLLLHLAHARCVRLDGTALPHEEIKTRPRFRPDEAMSLVPAYVGYLLANALTGTTRSWAVDQHHEPAAVLAVDALTGNLEPQWKTRYPLTEAGLSRICRDLDDDPDMAARIVARGECPRLLGLHYVHAPLPGQELVAFLDRTSLEAQRGGDRAPRWWRGEDTGFVLPIMPDGGRADVDWLPDHLQQNGFDPVPVQRTDPAGFAWLILEMSERLENAYAGIRSREQSYPVRLPFGVARSANEGTSLPDSASAEAINEALSRLYVAPVDLRQAISRLGCHERQGRVPERDHPLRTFRVPVPTRPVPQEALPGAVASPLIWIDEWFCRLAESNPDYRVRVGDVTGSRRCRLNRTEDVLYRRMVPGQGSVAGSLTGSVVAGLDEEAVLSAVFANRQGLGLGICRESASLRAFSVMRQEVECARQWAESGREIPWLSRPIVICSPVWEGDAVGQGASTPVLSEAWMEEDADLAPVFFPIDANTAVAALYHLYGQRGRVAAVVTGKATLPVVLDGPGAERAVKDGAVLLRHDPGARLQLIAVGAYQLQAVLRAAELLRAHDVACSVVAIIDPTRFRQSDAETGSIIPTVSHRLFVCHTRAQPMSGALRCLDTGPERSRFMGYRNFGGAIDIFGTQFRNRQTWAHVVCEAAQLLGCNATEWLSDHQLAALDGREAADILR
ncbi:MAG: hypothetical protein ACQETO_06745 [Pseudomonadota bacterium]